MRTFHRGKKHARKQFSANCKAESQFRGRVVLHVSVPLRSVRPARPARPNRCPTAIGHSSVSLLMIATDLLECAKSRKCGQERGSSCVMSASSLKLNTKGSDDLRFEVLTAVTMKNGVFWNITPCGSCKNRRFGGTSRLLHRGDKNR
jgi:hypothetical protein